MVNENHITHKQEDEKQVNTVQKLKANPAVRPPIKNLDQPHLYQNRELSWLDFNYRVIAEAEDPHNPLAEQLTFLAIGSTNLDEFMRVRVAGLQDQVKYGQDEKDSKKQWPASKQLEEIAKKNQKIVDYQYQLYKKKMKELEESYHYAYRTAEELTVKQKKEAERLFKEKIQMAITPFGIDAYRPFPQLDNESIHLFVRLEKEGDPFIAIIPLPDLLDRYYIVEEENGSKLILLLEDIVKLNATQLFKGYDLKYSFNFRISRNADAEIYEEGAEDLLLAIENYLERRENGVAVRLEIDSRKACQEMVKDVAFLMEELKLKEQDVYSLDGPLDLDYLWQLRSDIVDDYPQSSYTDFDPLYPEVMKRHDLFDLMDQGEEFLLHHPFDSFDPIIEMVVKAAADPQTVSIKQTLYRVSQDSPLISQLKKAAKAGIQVTVLVELKARFDEQNNVVWAAELEEAGVHVIYGVKQLKTHSKATLIVKKKKEGYKRYFHLGTGNYNDKTARQYTDLGLMSSEPALAEDVFNFFNYLSGFSQRPEYNHLHVSPFELRHSFMDKIDTEIENQRKYGNGHIIAKMNSLTDKQYIKKLYEASQAGVKIDLIIRGICCLIPGIKGLSETITVRSIVGRFLEHTRIYYFHNNGDSRIYLSSADMMTRNLSRRVELAFPIHNESFRQRLVDILDLYLADNYKSWQLNSQGIYIKNQAAEGEEECSAQKTLFIKTARKKEEQAQKTGKNWFERLSERLLRK